MTLLNDAVHADEWLATVLLADATLASLVNGVYQDAQETDAAVPIIRCDLLDEHDVRPLGQNRVMTELVYLVRAITHGPSWEEARTIADRIDAVLHGGAGTTATLRVMAVTRERPHKQTTIESRKIYRHAGGVYRLLVQPL